MSLSYWYGHKKYLSNRKSARAWRSGRDAKSAYYSARHFARMAKRYK